MNQYIQIWYSWGDQESPVEVPEGTNAWEYMKKLAIDEASVSFYEHEEDGEIGLEFYMNEGKIVLHYPYDDEYCYYLITDTENDNPTGEHNMKYILIYVYEREINTAQFSTFAEARHLMVSMLKKSVRSYFGDKFEEEFGMDINEFFNQETIDEYGDFELNQYSAWSNLHGNEDWKIVEVN